VKTALSWSKDVMFHAMFLMSILAFSPDASMDLLRTIVSFALIPDLKLLLLPPTTAYAHFRAGEIFGIDSITQLMAEAKQPYVPDPNAPAGKLFLRRLDHEKEVTRACKALAASIQAQWPSRQLDLNNLAAVDPALLDRDEALAVIIPEWSKLMDNFYFSQHIDEVQLILHCHSEEVQTEYSTIRASAVARPLLYPMRMRGGDRPGLCDILEKDIVRNPGHVNHRMAGRGLALTSLPNGQSSQLASAPTVPLFEPARTRKHLPILSHVKELSKLIVPYQRSPSMVHRRYGAELEASIDALAEHLSKPEVPQNPYNPTKQSADLFNAKKSCSQELQQFRNALLKDDTPAEWLSMVGLWPRVTVTTVLTELRSTSGVKFGVGVKETLIELGLTITKYQRLLRINDAILKERRHQLHDELENCGHENWLPHERADWLILEVESNIMIRAEQVDVALATISPVSQQNSVLQLLIGKGKTSCILRTYSRHRAYLGDESILTHSVAMVALELANNNLCRIVVPRPLLLQSAQIMQAKLGGLLNREIIHVPFSRKTPTNKAMMHTFRQLHDHTQKQNGIILALPEHVLSFRLSGLHRLCDGRMEEAATMITTQAWFDHNARDVLDECDVSLAIRTQLIYPSGSQQTVDGHPFRWQTVQAILDLVSTYLNELMQRFPSSIEVVERAGFPLVYFLRKDAEDYLIAQISRKICAGQTVILPVGSFSMTAQKDILDFITLPMVNADVTERVLSMFTEKRHLTDVVLHLRGLLVHRILLSTLKKRWNVQYGLNPARDPIAVPFHVSTTSLMRGNYGMIDKH
jgi:hypothetical protein